MPKLANIVKKTHTIEVSAPGVDEKIQVEYRVNAVTPEFLTEMEDHGKERALYQVVKFVKSWDVLAEDNTEYPLTIEALRAIPINILTAILEAIDKDINGWSKDEKKS